MDARPTVLLVMAIALGGVSAFLPDPKADAASPDACAMLTSAEVGAALGVAVNG